MYFIGGFYPKFTRVKWRLGLFPIEEYKSEAIFITYTLYRMKKRKRQSHR